MQMQQPDMAAAATAAAAADQVLHPDAVMPDAATIPQVQQAPAAAAAAVAAAVVDTARESEALNPWRNLNPRHPILAASPLETKRMHQVTSETASLLERVEPPERATTELAYRIYAFYHASTDKDVRSYLANLLKDLHRKFHALNAFQDPYILQIINKP